MPRYIVGVKEVHIHKIQVEANSEDEAKMIVKDGAGEYIDHELEYDHTLDDEDWTVEIDDGSLDDIENEEDEFNDEIID